MISRLQPPSFPWQSPVPDFPGFRGPLIWQWWLKLSGRSSPPQQPSPWESCWRPAPPTATMAVVTAAQPGEPGLPEQVLATTPGGPVQGDHTKAHLDLILLALEALTGIGSEAMLQAAAALNLSHVLTDRVTLWRLRQVNPLRRGSGGRKRLDVEEARSLVLISCHLAQEHQPRIRQAVVLLEELTISGRLPHQHPLLGDYLDQFTNLYQERMVEGSLSTDALAHLALKLLIDLLFYSGPGGYRRLWLALLDSEHSSDKP